jgi:hypothetical protein
LVVLLVTALWGFGACGAKDSAQPGDAGAAGANAVTVLVVGLSHPPVERVASQIEQLVRAYGGRVQLRRVDIESKEGEELTDEKDLTGHVPLAVFVEGGTKDGGREARFVGFPKGQGPVRAAEGEWMLEDLRTAVDGRLAPTG